MDLQLLERSLSLFSNVSVVLTGFVGVVFSMRVVFLQGRVAGPYQYASLMQDMVTYFALIQLFPMLCKLMFGSIAVITAKVTFEQVMGIQNTYATFLKSIAREWVVFEVAGKIFNLTVMVLVQSFYSVLIGLLLAIAPIVIFTSTILNLSSGVQTYFQTLLSMALWPVLWNLLGTLGTSLWHNFFESPFRTVIFWGVVQILQILSPLFCMLLFRSMSSSGAISSLIGMGKGI